MATELLENDLVSQFEGFILVGGASRRMGTDKALLRLEGKTFVDRIATELGEIVTSIKIVGRSLPEVESNLPSAPDVYENWGALGGLHAALSACNVEWAVVVACDLPFITAELLGRLAECSRDFEAVVPVQRDGTPQPLCGIYRKVPCLSRAEMLIKSGERRPIALLQSVHTRWIAFEEVADLEGAEHFFDNINSPMDYAEATQKGAGTIHAQDELT